QPAGVPYTRQNPSQPLTGEQVTSATSVWKDAVRDPNKQFLPPLDKDWHLRNSTSGSGAGNVSGSSSDAKQGPANVAANRIVGVRPATTPNIDKQPLQGVKPGPATVPSGKDTIGGGNSSNFGQ